MTNPANPRRRPSVHITLPRAARLHRLVRFLAEKPRARSAILSDLRIGLRTFYRELDLLNRCRGEGPPQGQAVSSGADGRRGGGPPAVSGSAVEFCRNGRVVPMSLPGRCPAGGTSGSRYQATGTRDEETSREVGGGEDIRRLKAGRPWWCRNCCSLWPEDRFLAKWDRRSNSVSWMALPDFDSHRRSTPERP